MPMEIERQFLLSELPSDIFSVPSVEMSLEYLSVTENREVRIREEVTEIGGFYHLEKVLKKL